MPRHKRKKRLSQPARRQRLLRPETLLYFCFLVLAAFALIKAVHFFPGLEQSILGYESTITVEEVLQDTNQERSAQGLTGLKLSDKLSQAAQRKGEDMLAGQYWSHTSPTGREPWDFITESGYVYKTAGENLARDFSDTSELMSAWMASPTHQRNILNPQFQEIGIAVVQGELNGFETTLVVQMFGTPASKTALLPSHPQLLDSAAAKGMIEEDSNVLAGTVLSPDEVRNATLFTPLQLTKAFFLIVIVLIVMTLIYDSFIAGNHKAAHILRKNLGHLMVFSAVTFIIIFFRSGVIN